MHRLNHQQLSPSLASKLLELNGQLAKSELGHQLLDLVFLRASQMNGCALCVDMHVKEARLHDVRDLKVHHVPVWRESPLFSECEKIAMEWTEVVTRITPEGLSDDLYARAKKQFTDKELSDLTYAVGIINTWNRLAITFRVVPGSYDSFMGLDKAGY